MGTTRSALMGSKTSLEESQESLGQPEPSRAQLGSSDPSNEHLLPHHPWHASSPQTSQSHTLSKAFVAEVAHGTHQVATMASPSFAVLHLPEHSNGSRRTDPAATPEATKAPKAKTNSSLEWRNNAIAEASSRYHRKQQMMKKLEVIFEQQNRHSQKSIAIRDESVELLMEQASARQPPRVEER